MIRSAKISYGRHQNSPKFIFLLGLLWLVSVGCHQLSPSRSWPTGVRSSSTKANRYGSPNYNFQFRYPQGYTLEPTEENTSVNQRALSLATIEIWTKSDYEAIQNQVGLGGEYLPKISISIYKNVPEKDLSAWKGDGPTREERLTKVAGQEALAYKGTGLYESDNVVFRHPQDQYIIQISGTYIEEESPLRQAFQQIVSSFEFKKG